MGGGFVRAARTNAHSRWRTYFADMGGSDFGGDKTGVAAPFSAVGGSTVSSQRERRDQTGAIRLQGLQADWKCVRVGASAERHAGLPFLAGHERERDGAEALQQCMLLLPFVIVNLVHIWSVCSIAVTKRRATPPCVICQSSLPAQPAKPHSSSFFVQHRRIPSQSMP